MKSKTTIIVLMVILSFVAFGAGFLVSGRANMLLMGGAFEAASSMSVLALAIIVGGIVLTIVGAVLSRRWAIRASGIASVAGGKMAPVNVTGGKPETLWTLHGVLLCLIMFQVWYISLGMVSSFL